MFTKLAESVRSYLRARDSEFALASLSDAALDDIGLTRAGLAQRERRPQPVRREAAGPFFALPFQTAAQAA